MKLEKVTNESLNSTRRMINMTEKDVEIGTNTLIKLSINVL